MLMRKRRQRRGFSLVELIVVIAIITLLTALSFPVYSSAVAHAHCSVCASNMHGLGIAFLSYAYDNQGALPQRVVTGNKWPTLLLPYVGNDPSVYIDPGDPVATKIPLSQLISNNPNNSSFIFNGFNDLGADGNPNVTVLITNIPATSQLILLGQQNPGGDNFYLDVNEGDQNTVLKKEAYFGGSNYVFADGSLRYMSSKEYSDSMWLVNPNYVIPGS
jgi:prepilin-type N-terminal cleavage/methylation domain-containing protein